MSTEVIQPGTGQTVITTDNYDRHRGYEHRNHLDELIAREQAAFGRQSNADAQTIVRDVKDTRFDLAGVTERTGAAGALASSTTDRLVGSGFGGVHDRLCDAKAGIVGVVERGFTAAALASCKTDDMIAGGFFASQKQVSDAATSTLVGFKDLTALSYQIQGQALLEAAKNAAALQVQATANANAASVEATKNFYALSVEAVKNASAAELRAQQIAATAAAQAAECCCELKALITSDGNATRALINTNTVEQLRAQLVATQRLIPVTIPVGAG